MNTDSVEKLDTDEASADALAESLLAEASTAPADEVKPQRTPRKPKAGTLLITPKGGEHAAIWLENGGVLRSGETAEVPIAEAQAWIDFGLATQVIE